MNIYPLYRITYCSRNRIHGTPSEVTAELDGILAKSRRNNTAKEVTGALLYNGGNFAQVLEGPLAAIEYIFEKIQCDDRHSEVTVIENGPVDSRQFPDWGMAFTGTIAEDHLPKATAAFEAAFSHRSSASSDILNVLRELVVEEHEWILLDSAR